VNLGEGARVIPSIISRSDKYIDHACDIDGKAFQAALPNIVRTAKLRGQYLLVLVRDDVRQQRPIKLLHHTSSRNRKLASNRRKLTFREGTIKHEDSTDI